MTLTYEDDAKGVDIIDFYKNDYIQGVNNKKYPIPAVVKTRVYRKTGRRGIPFNKRNIFIRDDFTCQYCQQIFDAKDLTFDHVIPKSKWDYNKGSPTTWTNIVSACLLCNRKKSHKTLTEANMKLLNFPYMPTKSTKFLPIHRYLATIQDHIPKEWLLYLPESYKQDANL
jgi:5-methylcytosine-specific restriction endonuclease McrA